MPIDLQQRERDYRERGIRATPAELAALLDGERTIDLGRQYRSARVNREKIDEENRTVEFSLSSESPVDRWWGREILSHVPGDIRMEFLENGGAPVLKDHDVTNQVGVVERAWIEGRKLHVLARYSENPGPDEVFRDIKDGIRRNVSVGYLVHRMELVEEEEGVGTYRASDWEPIEASSVSIPADPSVGVGRAAARTSGECRTAFRNLPTIEERAMPEGTEGNTPNPAPAATPEPAPATPQVDVQGERKQAAQQAEQNERQRISDIRKLGGRFDCESLVDEAIDNGTSADDFQRTVLDEIERRGGLKAVPGVEGGMMIPRADGEHRNDDIGLSDKEASEFSFIRCMRYLAEPNNKRAAEQAAFELDVSSQASEARGISPQGIYIPRTVLQSSLTRGMSTRQIEQLRRATRTLNVGVGSAGGDLVATDLLSGSFIEVLRNRLAMNLFAPTILDGLEGDVDIPRQTSHSAAAWIDGEDGDAAGSEPAFDQVPMSPRTLGAYTEITRKLLLQSSLDIEALVRNDLIMAAATKISSAALYGDGLTGAITGVVNQTGIKTVDFVAEDPTWGEIVDMESAISLDNADIGAMAYLLGAGQRGLFKQTEKFSGTGQTIWEPGNMVNGYPTGVTNQVADHEEIFGVWSQLLIGLWGGLDMLLDPYTHSLKGRLRIVIHQSVDAAVRHPESFCHGKQFTP